MATLVLSTAGASLGGPLGSVMGALIGQSIDHALLGGSAAGAKIGDLSVQTSSYGTQIPRIYGAMRVAGGVVWATDLVEGAETAGAKGQPSPTIGYSVSLAVAVSSRPVGGFGRIWADGKLIRDSDGVFKIPTTFRTHDGGEDQAVDPLIGSAEGIGATPAYRGLAMAVFENLELVEFGNRIPFFTFEIFGQGDALTVGDVLSDATGGLISGICDMPIGGYAAYGSSMRAAVEPLLEDFDVAVVPLGDHLRVVAPDVPVAIEATEQGASDGPDRQPQIERNREPVSALPAAVRIGFYDAERDYQAGEVRAAVGSTGAVEAQRTMPIALTSQAAGTLASHMLARRWARRDAIIVRLPLRYLGLAPGDLVTGSFAAGTWRVDRVTLESFVLNVKLSPAVDPLEFQMPAEPMALRLAAPKLDDEQLSIALVDVPNIWDGDPSQATLLLAASSPATTWKRWRVEIDGVGATVRTFTAPRKSVLGTAVTALGATDPHLIDLIETVEVQLIDHEQWLTACSDDELANGTNLCALGRELLQFGAVTPLGSGRFSLSRLVRGRAGTEWACSGHEEGEPFLLLSREALTTVELPLWAKGAEITAQSYRGDGSRGSVATTNFTGESLRPPAPVRLRASFDASGAIRATWVRRSRTGWAWLDEVDAPLGESHELYRVTLRSRSEVAEWEVAEGSIEVAAAEVRQHGPGPLLLEVRQVGDFAASHPACITPVLP